MQVSPEERRQLVTSGWTELSFLHMPDILAIARQFGVPIPSRIRGPLVDELAPFSPSEARRNSMSAYHGKGSFPLHTDCANRYIPPRYIFLTVVSLSSDRPTVLLDTTELGQADENRSLRRDVWVVSGGRRPFLTTVLSDRILAPFSIFRFDPCCMRPIVGSHSAAVLSNLHGAGFYYKWRNNRILIIDNWRMLHGRGLTSDVQNERRVLRRVLVEHLGD